MSVALMQFCFLVSVLALNEKIHLHGTEDSWTGRKSMAMQ